MNQSQVCRINNYQLGPIIEILSHISKGGTWKISVGWNLEIALGVGLWIFFEEQDLDNLSIIYLTIFCWVTCKSLNINQSVVVCSIIEIQLIIYIYIYIFMRKSRQTLGYLTKFMFIITCNWHLTKAALIIISTPLTNSQYKHFE